MIVDFTRETYIGICKKEKEKIVEKIMKLKRIAVAVLSLALTAGAVGTVPVTTEAAVKGTITLSGSTSVSPLAQQLAKQFVKENSGVKIMENWMQKFPVQVLCRHQ